MSRYIYNINAFGKEITRDESIQCVNKIYNLSKYQELRLWSRFLLEYQTKLARKASYEGRPNSPPPGLICPYIYISPVLIPPRSVARVDAG
jgi:hypothetical protein